MKNAIKAALVAILIIALFFEQKVDQSSAAVTKQINSLTLCSQNLFNYGLKNKRKSLLKEEKRENKICFRATQAFDLAI